MKVATLKLRGGPQRTLKFEEVVRGAVAKVQTETSIYLRVFRTHPEGCEATTESSTQP